MQPIRGFNHLQLVNHRRSDGARSAGRQGIFYQHDGSRWCRITKCDTFGWRDATRCPTVRMSRQEKMVFESSSESRKSWDGHWCNIVAPNAFCTVWLSLWNIMSVFRIFQVPRRHAMLVATSVMAPWLVGAMLVTQIHLDIVQARYLFIDFAHILSYITSVYCECFAAFFKRIKNVRKRGTKIKAPHSIV